MIDRYRHTDTVDKHQLLGQVAWGSIRCEIKAMIEQPDEDRKVLYEGGRQKVR